MNDPETHPEPLPPAPGSALTCLTDPVVKRPWPNPTPEMLGTPEFEAVWQCIKRWDINVPDVYGGYCGATGNHVRAILDALAALPNSRVEDSA